jgi:predicted enzyme related to lactoylglutathione lyase
MKIKAIGFVAIPVTDIKRARSFYEDVLGLEVSDEMMSGKWVEYAVGDDTLAIANVSDEWTPSDQGTGAAPEVEDFDEAIRRLRDQQVHFAAEPLSHGGCAGSGRKQINYPQAKTGKRERSMQMITNEVAFVAIAVSDKERARKFYQETLELKPSSTQMDGAWVEYDLGPTTIGVGCHPAWKPSREGTTVAFEVEDIDAAIDKLRERGVSFDIEKTETPVCWMAQFRDPDGNKLVVHKRKN